MDSKPKTACRLFLHLCAVLALAASTGCATPYAVVDAPSEEVAMLSPAQLADARAREAELLRQIDEDMKRE